MRPLTLSASVLLLTALLGNHAEATSDAARLLLAQARQWEDRGRLDLAQNALEKISSYCTFRKRSKEFSYFIENFDVC